MINHANDKITNCGKWHEVALRIWNGGANVDGGRISVKIFLRKRLELRMLREEQHV